VMSEIRVPKGLHSSAYMEGQTERKIDALRAENEKLKKRMAEVLSALVRVYFAIHREAWEASETESEALDNLVDVVANEIDTAWPSGYTRDSTLFLLDAPSEV